LLAFTLAAWGAALVSRENSADLGVKAHLRVGLGDHYFEVAGISLLASKGMR